jgi:hypothetical protein
VPSFHKPHEQPDHFKMFNARCEPALAAAAAAPTARPPKRPRPCRSETVDAKPIFSRLLGRKRCVVVFEVRGARCASPAACTSPAACLRRPCCLHRPCRPTRRPCRPPQGFYEWAKEAGKKQPYYCYLRGEGQQGQQGEGQQGEGQQGGGSKAQPPSRPMMLAGLYDAYTGARPPPSCALRRPAPTALPPAAAPLPAEPQPRQPQPPPRRPNARLPAPPHAASPPAAQTPTASGATPSLC